jgi:hypothetical protein
LGTFDNAEVVFILIVLDVSKFGSPHHVIIGSPAPGKNSYFSFKEGGVIS